MSSSSSLSSSASASRKRRSQVLRSLSQAQQVSALAFGSFLTVHVAAPALALLAPPGSSHDVATGTMLLGRVWYQNPASEPVLVWGALTVHLLSGLARKAVIVLWEPPLRDDDNDVGERAVETQGDGSESGVSTMTSRRRRRRSLAQRVAALPSDWQTISGALLVPFTLHHAYLNRIVPSRSSFPISNLSPSELDYTYVAHGFSQEALPRAVVSAIAYTALIGLSIFHTCKGLQKMARWRSLAAKAKESGKSLPDDLAPSTSASSALSDSGSSELSKADSVVQRRTQRQRRNRQWDAAAGITTALICGGLLRLVREADNTPAFLAKRYEACYTLVWPYSRI